VVDATVLVGATAVVDATVLVVATAVVDAGAVVVLLGRVVATAVVDAGAVVVLLGRVVAAAVVDTGVVVVLLGRVVAAAVVDTGVVVVLLGSVVAAAVVDTGVVVVLLGSVVAAAVVDVRSSTYSEMIESVVICVRCVISPMQSWTPQLSPHVATESPQYSATETFRIVYVRLYEICKIRLAVAPPIISNLSIRIRDASKPSSLAIVLCITSTCTGALSDKITDF
jgi:hypothetical protein